MKTQFTVDKEFIKEAYNSACSDWKAKLKNKFPQAFESELEVGKWYKMPKYGDAIFCITKIQNCRCFAYGINYIGEWRDEKDFAIIDSPEEFILATDKEVETALISEAKRRGFKEGVDIVDLYNGKSKNDYVLISSDDFEYEKVPFGKLQGKMALRDSDGSILFINGKWAEIISEQIELTLEQRIERIEEQLKIKK